MIKLVDKIKKQLDTATPNLNRPIYQSKKIEKIADDYAIDFLKFTEGTYSFGNIIGKWYLHTDTSNEYTTKELLEIYKKEKGL